MKSTRGIRGLKMQPLVWFAAVLPLGLLVTSGPVYAGSCGATATCTFESTVSNVTELSPIDIRVTWNNTGSVTVLSVQWISGGPGTPGFINEFGYNSTATTTGIGGNIGTSHWQYVGSQNQEGSFGPFLGVDQGTALGQNNPGVGGAITFTLDSKIWPSSCCFTAPTGCPLSGSLLSVC